MKKNIELKIYELLGIKTFRKLIFFLRDSTIYLLPSKLSKEEKKKSLYSTPTNYNIGGYGLRNLKDFKWQIALNTLIHITAIEACIPYFFNIIAGVESFTTTIFTLSAASFNLYCIMLQRYNYIRINQVIKKRKPHEEKKKNMIKEELKKKDQLLKQHSYKIIDKYKKEQEISIDELLNTASLEELKDYRKRLTYFTHFKDYCDSMDTISSYISDTPETSITVPIEKNKALKLELK